MLSALGNHPPALKAELIVAALALDMIETVLTADVDFPALLTLGVPVRLSGSGGSPYKPWSPQYLRLSCPPWYLSCRPGPRLTIGHTPCRRSHSYLFAAGIPSKSRFCTGCMSSYCIRRPWIHHWSTGALLGALLEVELGEVLGGCGQLGGQSLPQDIFPLLQLVVSRL